MSTFMQKPAEVQRKWYVLDAAGKPVGRVAAVAASILRGKVKPTFTPNVDCGDGVIIINCAQAIFTGNKMEQKYYRRHTGYIGGLKEEKARIRMASRPELVMYDAVRGMLPKTTLGRKQLTRIRCCKADVHTLQGQNPEPWAGEIR